MKNPGALDVPPMPSTIIAPDLRRRPERRAAEAVLNRSGWLRPDDRSLVHAVYERGQSAVAVAALLACRPRDVRRRLHRIVRRTMDPLFVYVALHRGGWPEPMRSVATACILHGLPIREAAGQTGLSYHAVRRERAAVIALYDAARKKADGSLTAGSFTAETQRTQRTPLSMKPSSLSEVRPEF